MNYFKMLLALIIPFSISTVDAFSQGAPVIQWQNTIGGDNIDELRYIEQTDDGGFILGGFSNSDSSGDKSQNNYDQTWHNTDDYWVVKVDSLGNLEWEKTIGGNDDDKLWSISQTSDGGYILGGDSKSNISGDKTENGLGFTDYWIVKLNAYGNIEWQNTIGGINNDYCRSIQQTLDGGYIVGGSSSSDTTFDKTEACIGGDDYWILKLDSLGNIQWQNTIGGSSTDNLISIKQTNDNGYILAGYSWSNISGDKAENNLGIGTSLPGQDFWIIKVDSLGIIEWQNTLGGIEQDELWSAEQTFDNGYILSGWSTSNISNDKSENNMGISATTDFWVVKLDSIGNIQWENTIGGDQYDWLLGGIHQTIDGGYIVGGYSTTNISGDKTENNCFTGDYWVFKLDAFGNILWQNTIGGDGTDGINSLTQTLDGGYILAGTSGSNISCDKSENRIGSWDYWIVKLAPDAITGVSNFQFPIFNFQINPNPFVFQAKLAFRNPNKEKFLFTLYELTGKITETVSTTSNEIILSKGNKHAGVYFFNLVNEKTGERWNGKVVIN